MKSTALRLKQCLTRGVVLKIVDEHDLEVPSETVGKIITRGPHVMPGDWNKPEETAQALRYLRERRHLWPVCPLALPSHRQRFDLDRTLVVG
jgi:acyl-CoA synthetase (AMP-forming)/AMP-acid ligase II